MISFLRGTLCEALPTHIVIDVGGVGYDVLIPLSSFDKLPAPGHEVKILTHLAIRDDAHVLYGFMTAVEREIFRLLITAVSGIGPKIALGALSGSPVGDLVAAIRDQNLAFLTRLPGIGKKTAERMTVELKDSLIGFDGAMGPREGSQSKEDAIAALVSLGYSRPASTDAVRKASGSTETTANVEFLVRLALAQLAESLPEKSGKAVSRS